ncbi:MAG: RNA-binding transcriptional accessory protein [Bacteroidales bacterium]|nr:RNA-binding transcriptional accessory protein [Bacteroidales bacterium]
MINFAQIIATELDVRLQQVENTIELLESGATIPFISRYRKEATGSLDEVQIGDVKNRLQQLQELEKRRKAILESIDQQEKLTPELKKAILNADNINELEDLYLPYKQKRRTRAAIAREKGLEPLAKLLLAQQNIDVTYKAESYVDDEKGVESTEDALAGARDIIAEWVNEDAEVRKKLREIFEDESAVEARVIKGKEESGEKYKDYFEWDEDIRRMPSHRILALFRGENEKVLRVNISIREKTAHDLLQRKYVKARNESAEQVTLAVHDSYKRLLHPSMENETRTFLKERADQEAIKIFADNLRQLLLASPLGQKRTLAIDPGFRTGCKVVCLDAQGNLLHNETIYPHPPQRESAKAMGTIRSLVSAYKIEAIAIGNGTAGRETEDMIRKIRFDKDLIAVMVNESGASIYSASKVAREEFPDYDVTVRGAVSIGRRLLDPLAELVKLEPKSIGVGQYQHDVNQSQLNNGLTEVVESCVNQVGVEINTASKQLLAHVSGLGPTLAQNIVDYRKENGAFKNRKALKKVARFGDKAFEQAAGFLRIHGAENPLDSSAVHPESYHIVVKMAKTLGLEVKDLVGRTDLKEKLNLNDFVTDNVGLPTLNDIIAELAKPGRDPRKKFAMFKFDDKVKKIEDLHEGMKLPGIVTNITAFGAFVDVGVHQDGLVHVSQLADKFVKDPHEIVSLNQKVEVTVVEVDVRRKRIQLSMKK